MTSKLSKDAVHRVALGVMMGGFEGTRVPDWLLTETEAGLASVCLFSQNTPDLGITRAITDRLGDNTNGPVVCVDEEGGDVTRLQSVQGSGLPGNSALGHLDDIGLTLRCGAALGNMCAQAGIDVALGPVLDVASEPCSSAISTRSFGPDPHLVLRHGGAWLDGLYTSGTRSCAKHFPGHGATAVDSHSAMPVLTSSLQTLRDQDMAPFLALSHRLDAIMTAHIVVREMGDQPASLSSWATAALREGGFAGVIMTDALGMRAITANRSLGEGSVLALRAGADLLCLDAPHQRDPRTALREVEKAIVEAVVDGTLSPDRLQASAERNRRLKREQPRDFGDGAEAELDRVGLIVARRSLQARGDCTVTGAVVVVDLRRRANLAVSHSLAFIATLTQNLSTSRTASHPGDIRPGEMPVVVTRQGRCDPTEEAEMRQVLAGHPDAVVLHAGLPSTAPEHTRVLLCHGVGRANACAAAERLTP